MKKIYVSELAYARSGDKGNICNIGVLANSQNDYEILEKNLTAEKVHKFFSKIGVSKVERFSLPNVNAFNFLLHNALDGGGTTSLRIDSQGKTLAAALLRLQLEISN
jgi:hypothetical protein